MKDSIAIKEALRCPTLSQKPRVIKLHIKNVDTKGIEGLPFKAFGTVNNNDRRVRDKANAAKLGFDRSETGGTGFKLIHNERRVRMGQAIEMMSNLGYSFHEGYSTQHVTCSGRLSAAVKMEFRLVEPQQKVPQALRTLLQTSYLDDLIIYANPTGDGYRIDSIECVKGQPPKGGAATNPGQLLQFDGTKYEIVDLMDVGYAAPEPIPGGIREQAAQDVHNAFVEADDAWHEDEAERDLQQARLGIDESLLAEYIGVEPTEPEPKPASIGTNLGDLLRQCLGGK